MAFYNMFGYRAFFVAFFGMLLSAVPVGLAASYDGGIKDKLYTQHINSSYKFFLCIFVAPILAVEVLEMFGISIHINERIINALLAASVIYAIRQSHKATVTGLILLGRGYQNHLTPYNSDDEMLNSIITKVDSRPYKWFLSSTTLYYSILLICAVWEIIDPVIQ